MLFRIMKSAKAVVNSPRVTKAGFVCGGSGGEALVLARDKSGRWLGPAFYNMGAAGATTAFYGQAASPVDILVRGSVSSPATAPLQQSLARMAR